MPVTAHPRRRAGRGALLLALAMLAASGASALAQAKNPFSVGISEGGGVATGLTGWLLAQQGWMEHQMALGVRAAKAGTAGIWPLATLSFVYGVFHAAGPGHGKAVLASYMVANERAVRRGMVLSFAAAALQGLVAVVLISLLTLVLHTTAQHIKSAASWVEFASFVTVAALGAQLVWRKGRALRRAWGAGRVDSSWLGGGGSIFAAPSSATARFVAPGVGLVDIPVPRGATAGFVCAPADAAHRAECLHCAAPDPRALQGERFDVRQAAATVLAAGLRPCSGAILVLVFAIAQGYFAAGIVSVAAMSLGVAVTTSALACCAVAFKAAAARIAGRTSPTAVLAGAGVEFAAACAVLAAGLLLLTGHVLTGLS